MKFKWYEWFVLGLVACALIAALSFSSMANTVTNGTPVTRFTGVSIDNTNANLPGNNGINGAPIYGIYKGTASFAGGTTASVTLTGASSSAVLLSSKGNSTNATYVKTAVMSSAGVALLTMSGATTGSLPVVAIDFGTTTTQ